MSTVKEDTIVEVIRWDACYSVGITEIDLQHRMMTQMLNELNNARLHGKSRETAANVLAGMVNYIHQHMENEERLFDDYAYPFSATHKEEHRVLDNFLENLYRDFSAGKTDLSGATLQTLSNWLQNHFISKDKPYSYFFIPKGLN